MGPPREHGGMRELRIGHGDGGIASMGPPREHGGMVSHFGRWRVVVGLQWGRRVNTAECGIGDTEISAPALLQWGRRVNTAEWRVMGALDAYAHRFNGAAA